MLAEAFYRRDDFQKAAAALNGVDVSSNQLLIIAISDAECREAGELQGRDAL